MKPGPIMPPINAEKMSAANRRAPSAITSVRVVLSMIDGSQIPVLVAGTRAS
jgi:hypothetical protein